MCPYGYWLRKFVWPLKGHVLVPDLACPMFENVPLVWFWDWCIWRGHRCVHVAGNFVIVITNRQQCHEGCCIAVAESSNYHEYGCKGNQSPLINGDEKHCQCNGQWAAAGYKQACKGHNTALCNHDKGDRTEQEPAILLCTGRTLKTLAVRGHQADNQQNSKRCQPEQCMRFLFSLSLLLSIYLIQLHKSTSAHQILTLMQHLTCYRYSHNTCSKSWILKSELAATTCLLFTLVTVDDSSVISPQKREDTENC